MLEANAMAMAPSLSFKVPVAQSPLGFLWLGFLHFGFFKILGEILMCFLKFCRWLFTADSMAALFFIVTTLKQAVTTYLGRVCCDIVLFDHVVFCSWARVAIAREVVPFFLWQNCCKFSLGRTKGRSVCLHLSPGSNFNWPDVNR